MTTLARGDIYDQNNNLVLSSNDENYNEKINNLLKQTDNFSASSAPATSTSDVDLTEVYKVLAPMAGDYANAQAEQIGQAQQSMGPLAAATMGQSRTSGLGNYTYNRLIRPQVDTMRDEILVQGYTNRLNKLLSDKLREAQRSYQRASSGGSSGSSNSNSGLNNKTVLEPNGNNPSSMVPNDYYSYDGYVYFDQQKEENRNAQLQYAQTRGLTYKDDGTNYWITDSNGEVIKSGRL